MEKLTINELMVDVTPVLYILHLLLALHRPLFLSFSFTPPPSLLLLLLRSFSFQSSLPIAFLPFRVLMHVKERRMLSSFCTIIDSLKR